MIFIYGEQEKYQSTNFEHQMKHALLDNVTVKYSGRHMTRRILKLPGAIASTTRYQREPKPRKYVRKDGGYD